MKLLQLRHGVYFLFFILLSFGFTTETLTQKVNYYENKLVNTDLFLTDNLTDFPIEEVHFFLINSNQYNNPKLKIIRNLLIGNIYTEYEKFDTALVFFEKSKKLAIHDLKKIKNQRLYIISLINIAKTNAVLKNESEITENIQQAIFFSKKYNFNDLFAISNFYYAKLLAQKSIHVIYKNLKIAEDFFLEKEMKNKLQECSLIRSTTLYLHGKIALSKKHLAEALKKETSGNFLADLYFLKARIEKSEDKNDFAIKNYLRAINISKKRSDYKRILKASSALFQLYESMKEYKKAFNTQRVYKEAKDSLNKISSQRKIFIAKVQYEFLFKENTVLELELTEIQNKIQLEEHKNRSLILYIASISFTILLALIIYFYLLSKRFNNQLIKKNEELQDSNLNLAKTKQDLEELGRNKDRFFSIIAHDLRIPFNSVLGLSEYISESISELPKKEILELNKIVHTSSKSLYYLLQNLLDWSKSQIGKLEHSPQLYDLHGIAEKELEILRIFAQNKEIRINCSIKKGSFAYFDKDMIATVIRNITNNAIKFTKNKGEINLSVKKNTENIKIAISDNGIGISDENQKELFNANKQLTSLGTSGEKGTGLGLAICKEFILLNNGEITLKSKEGKGSEFQFTLPRFNVEKEKL